MAAAAYLDGDTNVMVPGRWIGTAAVIPLLLYFLVSPVIVPLSPDGDGDGEEEG